MSHCHGKAQGAKTNGTEGAIIDLVCKGSVDDYISVEPTFSPFVREHKQTTNFVHEAIDMTQETGGQLECGRTAIYEFNGGGDLIYQAYVRITLPALAADACTLDNGHGFGDHPILSEFTTEDNGAVVQNNKICVHRMPDITDGLYSSSEEVDWGARAVWTNGIGFALIKSAEWQLCSQNIDKIKGRYLYIWDEITSTQGLRCGEMVGRFDSADDQVEFASKERVMFVPLEFDFCCDTKDKKGHSRALPVVKVQFSKLKIALEIEDAKNLMAVALPCNRPEPMRVDPVTGAYSKRNATKTTAQYAADLSALSTATSVDTTTLQVADATASPPVPAGYAIAVGTGNNDPSIGDIAAEVDRILDEEDDTVYLSKPYVDIDSERLVPGVPIVKKSNGATVTAYDVSQPSFYRIKKLNGDWVAGANPGGEVIGKDFFEAAIECETVYLDTAEREIMADPASVIPGASSSVEYLCVMHADECIHANASEHPIIKPQFNHPSKELLWTVQPLVYPEMGQYFALRPVRDNCELIHSADLQLNGKTRFNNRPATYYRLQQMHQHHTSFPHDHIYCYSFATCPESDDPDSCLNLSRIDNVRFLIDLNEQAFSPEMSALIEDGLSQYIDKVEINLYNRFYNVLRYEGGLAGLVFSS